MQKYTHTHIVNERGRATAKASTRQKSHCGWWVRRDEYNYALAEETKHQLLS